MQKSYGTQKVVTQRCTYSVLPAFSRFSDLWEGDPTFRPVLLPALRTHLVQDGWYRCLHGRTLSWKLSLIQTLSQCNRMHFLDVTVLRTSNLFILIYFRLVTHQVSSKDLLWLPHRIDSVVWAYLASDRPPALCKKLATNRARKLRRTSIHDRALRTL